MNNSWLSKPIVKLCLGLLVLLVVGVRIYFNQMQPVAAQSTGVLSSELLNLRTRVNLLEAEVRRLRQSGSRTALPRRTDASTPAPPINLPQTESQLGSTDPMFQRLATLVIELKERIVELEKRTATIEEKLNVRE